MSLKDLSSMNTRSNKVRQVRLAWVCPVVEDANDDLSVLQPWTEDDDSTDAPEVVWQIKLQEGWKMMGEAESDHLTESAKFGNRWTTTVHHWKHPETGKMMATLHSIDFASMTQKSNDCRMTARPIRLVQVGPLRTGSRLSANAMR